MRAVLQRAAAGSVDVNGTRVAEIGRGIVVLLGVREDDTEAEAGWMAGKLVNLRIFPDDKGKLNLSVLHVGGSALMVPNFTLYGDARKGRRPSFTRAAQFDGGKALFERCCDEVQGLGVPVGRGVYGASMMVSIQNEGPVTLLVDSDTSVY
jgi:D-tyrosyl-tRNA(Tyr) deacylase